MPRLKDSRAERRRCNQACDSCRRRKEKCDSLQPCAGCVKRDIECIFTSAPPAPLPAASTSLDPTSIPPPKGLSQMAKKRKIVHLSDELDSSDAEVAIDLCLNAVAENPVVLDANGTPQKESSYESPPSQAPVPRVARLLRDGCGKFIYIGDSASLSFLQNVRRIARDVVGECDLTADRLRHSFLEKVPTEDGAGGSAEGFTAMNDNEMRPTLAQAEMLGNQYLTATACLLDLFESKALFQALHEWAGDPSANTVLGRPIVYLVLAIGAQVTAENEWDAMAERYFVRGRHLALLSYTNEPSLQTVQSFLLITMYMLGDTRRNAAFMNLGIAVRAAHALGMHRGDVQTLFPQRERQARERIWQSLRVVDLFLSASLGRPAATSDSVKDLLVADASGNRDSTSNDARFASAVLSLVSIFERILSEVYKKRSVSTEVADDISRQYREWTSRLPSLPVDLINRPTTPTNAEMARTLATAHLIGAYHWSIILLTRPFLILHVSLQHQKRSGDEDMLINKHLGVSAISTYAEASIDSAVRGLDIAADLVHYPGLPKRLPFITNSVFNSALAIGVAFFGDFDRSYELADGMRKAEQILAHLCIHEPQARRYAQIVGFLNKAAIAYVHRRDRSSMEHRMQKRNDLFGIVGLESTRPLGSPVSSRHGRSPVPLNRRDSNPVHHWNPAAPGAPTTRFNHTGQDGANMVLTPPDTRCPADMGPYPTHQPTLTTSGFFISRPVTYGQAPRIGDDSMLTAIPPDFQDATWDVLGDETLGYAEMIPTYDLFNEPGTSSYVPM